MQLRPRTSKTMSPNKTYFLYKVVQVHESHYDHRNSLTYGKRRGFPPWHLAIFAPPPILTLNYQV